MGLFAEMQPIYAAHGIPIFPVMTAGGAKRPAIKGYLKVGPTVSEQLALRFPNVDALGFALGKRSKIAVLDVDSRDERVLADALSKHGDTPIIVRSGSGNYQAWYTHNGETRRIRPFAEKPIDILGGGFVVAPPSMGAIGRYEFIAGGLDDLDRLPKMRGLTADSLLRPDAGAAL